MILAQAPGFTNRWLSVPRRVVAPRVRLICVPHAGASASMFRAYARELPSDVELCAVQLPGHGQRFSEAPWTRIEPIVEALGAAVQALSDCPVALFGHSMGALIAFEVTQRLRGATGQGPVHLFVSGQSAPHLRRRRPPVHRLPTPDLVAELRQLGGTPAEVLDNRELLDLMLPLLRADFEVCETYVYQRQGPLPCPITAFGGLQDREAGPPGDLAAWRRHTVAEFRLQMLPGDHFSLVEKDRPRIVRAIAEALAA